jgi:hypothetical protein
MFNGQSRKDTNSKALLLVYISPDGHVFSPLLQLFTIDVHIWGLIVEVSVALHVDVHHLHLVGVCYLGCLVYPTSRDEIRVLLRHGSVPPDKHDMQHSNDSSNRFQLDIWPG